ncbi:MAG: hypothetical protein ACREOK_10750 [Gemmatimonadaceae bacterium]
MTAVALAVALVVACAAPPHQRDQIHGAPLTFADIERARSSRDYFALRERVRNAPRDDHAAADIAAALLRYAFNEPAQSNAAISRVLHQDGVPDTLADFIREIALDNHLRLFEYAKGLNAADSLLADTTHLERGTIRDVRNVRRIFQALASTEPQTVTIRGSSSCRCDKDAFPWQSAIRRDSTSSIPARTFRR